MRMHSTTPPPFSLSLAVCTETALHRLFVPMNSLTLSRVFLALVGLGESLVVMRVDEGQHVADHRV